MRRRNNLLDPPRDRMPLLFRTIATSHVLSGTNRSVVRQTREYLEGEEGKEKTAKTR